MIHYDSKTFSALFPVMRVVSVCAYLWRSYLPRYSGWNGHMVTPEL